MDKGVPVIAYYGASGHGKGLVDAMSGFGVKEPLEKQLSQKISIMNVLSTLCYFLKTYFMMIRINSILN